MKGKNWREYEPKKQEQKSKRKKRKKKQKQKKGGMIQYIIYLVLIFALGYFGFMYYNAHQKPYTIGLDAGHGGVDVGAVGIIHEVELTEKTVEYLAEMLEEDGRFRVILSREMGKGMSITDRNQRLQRYNPDIVLSVHGNFSEDSSAYGFECYPSPPGYENHEVSMAFAQLLSQEMGNAGARLRGEYGVRFGYYVDNANGVSEKLLLETSDTTAYDYDTFGILKNMDCPVVLVEQCFISNAEDMEKFGDDDGCLLSAQAYYRAICAYLDSLETNL